MLKKYNKASQIIQLNQKMEYTFSAYSKQKE